MAKTTELLYSMFDAASTVASGVDKYTQKQAELSTRTKSYQLKADIDGELARIRQSSTSDKWNEEINGFFENLKSQMSNPESPYYCKNNLQAEQFNALLGQNQVNVTEHVNNMVMQRQREERIVAAQNAKAQAAKEYSGQEYIDRCNDLDRLLFEGGDIGPQDYQAQKDINFMTGYRKMHTDVFDASFTTALQKGKSKEAYWEDIKHAVPQLQATDIKGLSKIVDTEAMDADLQKQAYQFYNARLADVQQGNANKLSEIYQKMQQQPSKEAKLNYVLEGQRAMRGMLGLQLSENDRVRYANYFKLEDPTITQSSAESALKKLTPKDRMDYFIHAWQRGDESEMGGAKNLYNAYEAFKTITLEEMQQARGNPGLQWKDIEKECPTYMEFLDYAKQNLPASFENVIKNAENVLATIVNTKDDKNLYKAEMNKISDWLYDLLFETNVSDLDGPELEKLNKRVAIAINSIYGGVLEKQKNYDWLKEEPSMDAVLNFQKGVIGNEGRLAAAIQARDSNPDLWFKDQNGTYRRNYDSKTETALTNIENAEKEEIQKYLKYTEGINIDTSTINGELDKEGVHDVQARKVYTVGDNQYRFRSDDGKKVIMEKKAVGDKEESWQQIKTAKEQKKYDSPRETAKRAVQDIDVSTVPPFEVPASGVMPKIKYTQKDWDEMNNVQKKNIIMSLLQKYPEEMQSWLDKQPDKSKKK